MLSDLFALLYRIPASDKMQDFCNDVAVFGRDPFRHGISNAYNIGVVFGQRTQLWWELPVIDSHRMIARIYDVPPSAFRTRIEAATDLLGLERLLQRPARTLSLGEKMRAELGSVLLHGPRLLLLNEPTLGVDLAGKRRIRQFLAELKKTGVTVFMATHDLADVESTCDRLIMVHQGRNLRLTFSRVRRICIPAMRQGIIRLSRFIPLAGRGGAARASRESELGEKDSQ